MSRRLGHIADTRNSLLLVLGEKPMLTEAELGSHGHSSELVLVDGRNVRICWNGCSVGYSTARSESGRPCRA